MTETTELHRSMGRIEGKLDTFIAQMKTQDDRTTDLEVRTRKVENRQHWYSGVGAAAGMLLGVLTGGHFLRVMVAAVALSTLLTSAAPGDPVVDARREAIIKSVRSIGVYPGAEIPILNNVYQILSVEVDARYTVTIKTRLLR